jgi:Tol biopolymer transport system component
MTWDEHAHYSPDGRKIAWMSSKDLRFEIKPFDLQTDFWIMNRNGTDKKRLTWFHTPQSPHYLARSFAVAADFDWSPSGNQIIALVITNRPDTHRRGSGLMVMIDLPSIFR